MCEFYSTYRFISNFSNENSKNDLIEIPKQTIEYFLYPYSIFRKLANFCLLGQFNKTELVSKKTCVKIINIHDAFSEEYLDNHISPCGLFMHCGKFIGGIFVSDDCTDQWQWLVMRIDNNNIDDIVLNKDIKIVRNNKAIYVFVDLSKNYVYFRSNYKKLKK